MGTETRPAVGQKLYFREEFCTYRGTVVSVTETGFWLKFKTGYRDLTETRWYPFTATGFSATRKGAAQVSKTPVAATITVMSAGKEAKR